MSKDEKGEKQIAFVLYPGLTLLDMVGPLTVLKYLGDHGYQMVIVSERVEPVETDSPLKVFPNKTFDEVPHPFGIIVPGGVWAIKAMGDHAIRDYLISAAKTAEVVGSVCTGSLILAAAGLLDGRQATTHWAYHRLLEKLGARYVRKRWVEDGKFITAAGVSAGIDMGLHLLAKLTDEATARQAQAVIEYDPEPPFGGIDWEKVDRESWKRRLKQQLKEMLGDRPELLSKLID